jgi:hypothetical protein
MPERPLKRKFTYESAYQNTNSLNLASSLFPRMIKREEGSIAESHAIDEPIIQPLLPSFRTPRRYNTLPVRFEIPLFLKYFLVL